MNIAVSKSNWQYYLWRHTAKQTRRYC